MESRIDEIAKRMNETLNHTTKVRRHAEKQQLAASVKIITITPEIAQKLISNHIYPGQRRLRSGQVVYLAEQMRIGTFFGGRINIAVCDGKEYVVNGQHTLHAIARSGIAVQCCVEKYTVSSYEEIGSLYGKFDIQLRRTDMDTWAAIGLPGELEINPTDLSSFTAGIKVILAGFKSSTARIDREILATHLRHWQAEAREYVGMVASSDQRYRFIFKRAAVWAVALVTIRHSSEAARLFWQQVLSDDGLKKQDARKLLRYELMSTTVIGSFAAPKARRVNTEDTCRMCIVAWNAFLGGKGLERFRYRGAGEVNIEKTPYKIGTPRLVTNKMSKLSRNRKEAAGAS